MDERTIMMKRKVLGIWESREIRQLIDDQSTTAMVEIRGFVIVVLLIAIICCSQIALISGQQNDGYVVNQIHLAQGKTPESMTISWVTKEASDSIVIFGTDAEHLENKVQGYSSKYTFDYPDLGVYQSGVIHHVFIENLSPSTTYFYQCGDFSLSYTSGVSSFTTAHQVGDISPFSFAVLGDLGQTTDSASTLNHIINNPSMGMILHAGDLSYADCNQQLWDSYGILIEDLAKERPWMVGPGNHEIEYFNNGSPYLAFEERYKMPAVAPVEYGQVVVPGGNDAKGNPYCTPSIFQSEYNFGNSFYSFEVASAHIIFLNPYSITNETSKQYQWLIKDLESVNRTKTPWVIAVMHCPWYNSDTAHHNEKQALMMQESMEPVFYKYHVNLVFAGHVHAYERSHPVNGGLVVEDGVVHITIGDGGNREGHAAGYYPKPDWSAFRNGTQYGHGELILNNKDQLTWKWHRNVDGEKITKDEITICNVAFNSKVYC